jgi:hypothetical protein
MTPAPNKTVYRASTTGVDVDAVYRTLRLLNAVTSWADPTRTLYQLGNCQVEVVDSATPAVLFVSGPTEDDARNAIARLGYGPQGVTITAIQPERPKGARMIPGHSGTTIYLEQTETENEEGAK